MLVAYADNEAAVEAEHPTLALPGRAARGVPIRTGADLGFPVTEADADALARLRAGLAGVPRLGRGARRLMAHYQLIILSNVDRASFAGSSRRLGVRFDAVYTAQDVGAYKPSDANFATCSSTSESSPCDPAACCTSRNRCSTTTFPPSATGCRASGSTAAGIARAGARPPIRGAVVTPDLAFESMAAFADAVDAAH